MGQGSGVIVSKDGYVLTAGHVIREPGIKLTVLLSDGRKAKAVALGLNGDCDAGLIKITDAGDWPFVEMGKSQTLLPGQLCVAMGHPGGFQRDRPPVPRLGRIIAMDANTLVTSCTTIGGDSGGPVFDLAGRVIGINSRIGQSLVRNMHVAIDRYTADWKRLTAGESWGTAITSPAGLELGLSLAEDRQGVRVQQVMGNSAASRAGIKYQDLIVKLEDQPIYGRNHFAELLEEYHEGDVLHMEVLRGREVLKIDLKMPKRKT